MLKPSSDAAIRLRGVRHNNLKNFDLDIPLGKLTVITGLSGSGKSSLAFDTLFAEGQRRYIETFSPYARQFFDRMDKPQVDRIEGIPPAIAIEQRNSVRSTRSTVGTMTEICDYLKVLWPHVARLHCRNCGQPVRKEPPTVVWEQVNAERETRTAECLITFDLPLSEKLSIEESLDLIGRQGYQRLLVGAEIVRLDEAAARLSRRVPRLTVVQDRLRPAAAQRARFVEACEQAYHFGKGRLRIHRLAGAAAGAPLSILGIQSFSSAFHCAACDLEYREPSPALFSFNHPVGACPACKGFGRIISIDYGLAIPDHSKSLQEGAVRPWQTGMSAECQADLGKAARKRMVPLDVPFAELSEQHQRWVIDGDPGYDSNDPENSWPHKWYGVRGYFRWLESKAYKMHVRVLLSRYRAYTKCRECDGQRFKPEALLYRVSVVGGSVISKRTTGTLRASAGSLNTDRMVTDYSLAGFYTLPVEAALALIEQLAARHRSQSNDPVALALNEVRARLRYLVEVGLGYLTLERPTRTLSGGETERVNLTTCLGTRLVNTLFVLDEPSVGLHARDTARLVRILEQLRDAGNTVVVVEHEPGVMRAADQVVDLGPGRGEKGGEVVFCGALDQLMTSERSLTGQYLSGQKRIALRARREVLDRGAAAPSLPRLVNDSGARATLESKNPPTHSRNAVALQENTVPYRTPETSPTFAVPMLKLTNASRHNLKNLSVEIPLGRFVALTGVSGSGKTTLAREVLLPALQSRLLAAASTSVLKASDRMDTDENEEGNSQFSVSNPQFAITGWESIGQVVLVDQSPLGKTPRSNPVVYLGAFDDVRDLFAQTDLAKQRGLNGSAFSFNSGVGQCERCRGAGFEKIEMQFLSDIFIRCPECNGRRYRGHILEVKLRGGTLNWSIADMLEATIDDALNFLGNFLHVPAGRRAFARLELLQEVGLGYLRLGQPINTLSGGESQRLKLVSHLAESAVAQTAVSGNPEHLTARNTITEVRSWLAKRRGLSPAQKASPRENRLPSTPSAEPKRTLFLFDEPTTGLHFDDVRVLLQVFQRIVDAGHSVVVIEHNLDVIKCADWVIDLGPDAGERGGQLVVCGTPEQVAMSEQSHTGAFLREVLAS
jgi:excinuclease ABC subunit A